MLDSLEQLEVDKWKLAVCSRELAAITTKLALAENRGDLLRVQKYRFHLSATMTGITRIMLRLAS